MAHRYLVLALKANDMLIDGCSMQHYFYCRSGIRWVCNVCDSGVRSSLRRRQVGHSVRDIFWVNVGHDYRGAEEHTHNLMLGVVGACACIAWRLNRFSYLLTYHQVLS